MICQPCRNGEHCTCPGGTHCACQHRTDRQPPLVDVLGDTYAAPVTASGFDNEEGSTDG